MKNVFYAFRIMVGIGLTLILLGLTGALLWWRKKLFEREVVSALRGIRLAARLHRDPRGLDHDGERPAAVHRVRTDAHQRGAFAGCGAAPWPHRSSRSSWCTSSCSRSASTTSASSSSAGRRALPSRHRAGWLAQSPAGHGAGADARDALGEAGAYERRGTSGLPLICAAVVALAVGLYVVLDGFDLGVGILFPVPSAGERARPDDEFRSRRSGTATRPG